VFRHSSHAARAALRSVMVVLTVAAFVAPALSGSALAATNPSANIDQCTNGAVGPPLTLSPCLNGTLGTTTYSDWVNGNSNGQKSHWREGEFISYRVRLANLPVGSHTLDIQYDTVHGGKHAIDYVGSFDATETTSTTANQFHRNNSNPCKDILPAAQCTPSSPISTLAVTGPPALALTNCAGSAGTFPSANLVPGAFKAFGPSGTSLGSMAYVNQNAVSGTGQCSTGIRITLNIGVANSPIVIAWGGHIASQRDWGAGNSATAISGSPYHMALDLLDGASTGSQDRALSTSAIFFSPTISTLIKDSAGNTVTQVSVGTTVHDTATLSGASSIAGGTVSYARFNNGTCSGTPVTTQTVNVTNAVVPDSSTFTPTAAGSYSYQATYSGDSQNIPMGPGLCEPLSVGTTSTTVTTHVRDAGGTDITGTSVALGTVVHDTATVNGQINGINATGTVTYSFFTNGSCSGTATSTQDVALTGGAVPNSSTKTLGAGSYSYSATYGGDGNYGGSTGSCEPFTINMGDTTTATAVHNPSHQDVTGTSVALGTAVHDSATVGPQVADFAITGTVTYSFFSNGSCAGTAASTEAVAVGTETTPQTLAAGSYSYKASYGGDGNYHGSTGTCEPFAVGKTDTGTATSVINEANGADVTGTTVALGTTVHDSATVGTPVNGFTITGTVTYSFFSNGGCSGTPVFTQDQTLSGGVVPNSSSQTLGAGSYSYSATYGGDTNYSSSTGTCEPITIGRADTGTATSVINEANGADVTGQAVALGTSVHDSARVSPQVSGFTATGTVTYSFFSNGDCSGTATSTQTVTLSGGAVPNSSSQTLNAGSYSYKASYSGDGNYNGSTGACEPFSVRQASPGGSTAQNLLPNDTATITGGYNPTGSVTFALFPPSNSTCNTGVGAAAFTQSVPVSGNGSYSTTNSAVLAAAEGTWRWVITYSGDVNNHSFTLACGTEHFTIANS
jgi:hypothetical protein